MSLLLKFKTLITEIQGITRILLFILLALTLPRNSSRAQVKATPAADRLQAISQKKKMESVSPLNSIKFKNIGPAIMSGRVVDLEVNAEDPTEFYVAYATGGLWHTTNNGMSFKPVMDSLDVLFIGDIAINWNTRTIWVGTGEANSSRSTYAGTGIYKTTDNGKTWTYAGLPESHHIGKIELHPVDDNTAWVAVMGHLYSPNAERGVFKTIDGGKTWKKTLYIDDNTGAAEVTINPSNPNELYAAMWYRVRRAWKFEESGPTSGIYKSIDGGETWKKLTVDGSGFMQGDKIGRIGLAVYPKNPSIVYAVVDNYMSKPDTAKRYDSLLRKEAFKEMGHDAFMDLPTNWIDTFLRKSFFPSKYTGAYVKEQVKNNKIKPSALWDYLDTDDGFQGTPYGCQVYRSNNGGSSWKKTNEKDINIFSTFGYYFGKIYVSPVNENKVIILGIRLQQSTDGGKTFKNIDTSNVHADHHALWINPKKDTHIIDGNDGGVNITYDNGLNWFFANTPPVGQFYSVNTDDDRPYNVYGGLQDNNVWYGPSTYRPGPGWQSSGDYPYKSLVGGDGMQVMIDTRDNSTTYAGSQFGVYSRLNRRTRSDRKSVRPFHELGEKPLRFNWQTPILLSKHNQDVFYIGANRLYRSLNKGDTLIAMSPDLTGGRVPGNVPYGTLTSLSESPLRFGLLYAGTDDGNVYLSQDAGYSWKQLNQNSGTVSSKSKSSTGQKLNTQNLWVSRVIASKYKPERAYVTLNGYRSDHFSPYVYITNDYGETWRAIHSNLPGEPVNVIREDPKSDSILYVGTDGGVYVSFDLGSSWASWTAGMPRSVPVHDIAIQQRENDIIVGTHGRSLYLADLDEVQKLQKDAGKRAMIQKWNLAPGSKVDTQ